MSRSEPALSRFKTGIRGRWTRSSMSYGIHLSTEAQHRLTALPIEVREGVLRQLRLLSENPTLLSVPSHFPWREKCQRFPFDLPHGTRSARSRCSFNTARTKKLCLSFTSVCQ